MSWHGDPIHRWKCSLSLATKPHLVCILCCFPHCLVIDLLLCVHSSQSHSRSCLIIICWNHILIIGSYKWALIELSRNQSFQAKLREELSVHFSHSGDPTYDQLATDLPYLDSVVHEVLRLHPPVWETSRVVRTFSFWPYQMMITDSYPSIGRGGWHNPPQFHSPDSWQ